MALLALAVLLFPVISLTDDLHAVIFACEDAARRAGMLSVSHGPVALVVSFVTALLDIVFLATVAWKQPESRNAPAMLAAFGHAVADPAPPAIA